MGALAAGHGAPGWAGLLAGRKTAPNRSAMAAFDPALAVPHAQRLVLRRAPPGCLLQGCCGAAPTPLPDRCPPRPADHPSAARMSPRALWRPVTAARGARTAPARPRPWRGAPRQAAPPPGPAPHPAHPNSGGTERRAWADAAPDLGGPRAGLHPAACRPTGWWPAELRAPPKLAALRRTILLSS